jgi:succinyl-diaminopimelate desuccinylase
MTERDDELRQRLIALTCDLMEIPRLAAPDKVREQNLSMIKHHIQGLPDIDIEALEQDGIPSLVVRPSGIDEPAIMLLAHVDVIEHADHDCYQAHLVDGRIVGPGAGDMKGQAAILTVLFQQMHVQYDCPSVGLIITTDEEIGGAAGVGYLFGAGKVRCGCVINPDGGSLNEVTTDEKGATHLRLSCHGKSCHAARPWHGDNALLKMMNGLKALDTSFAELQTDPLHWHPTCSVSIVETDNKSVNRVPSHASAAIDIRFPRPYTLADIHARVRTCLGPDIEVEELLGAEPVHLDPDPLFLECCSELCGEPARTVRDSGASDSRFIVEQGIPVIMSRPKVGNLHARDEWIDIESMITFYRICERYLERKLDLV